MKPIKNVFPASEGIVAKSDTQWMEVKALKWSDENEMKVEDWGQDSSHVHYFKLLRLCSKDTSFF